MTGPVATTTPSMGNCLALDRKANFSRSTSSGTAITLAPGPAIARLRGCVKAIPPGPTIAVPIKNKQQDSDQM